MFDNEEFKIKTGFVLTNFYKHDQILIDVHGKVVTLTKKDIEKVKMAIEQLCSETCLIHPTYKGIRKPTSKCPKCLEIYKRNRNK